MPKVRKVLKAFVLRHRDTEVDFLTINVPTSVEIVVGHPLKKVLKMGFIWLEDLLHDHTLSEQVCQSSHYHRVEHVDFQEVLIAHVIAIEGNALYKCDTGNILIFSIVDVSAIADTKSVIYRKMQSMYITSNLNQNKPEISLSEEIEDSPSSAFREPVYSIYK
jgi:hypothetical protein